jgi:hypothetical protein
VSASAWRPPSSTRNAGSPDASARAVIAGGWCCVCSDQRSSSAQSNQNVPPNTVTAISASIDFLRVRAARTLRADDHDATEGV